MEASQGGWIHIGSSSVAKRYMLVQRCGVSLHGPCVTCWGPPLISFPTDKAAMLFCCWPTGPTREWVVLIDGLEITVNNENKGLVKVKLNATQRNVYCAPSVAFIDVIITCLAPEPLCSVNDLRSCLCHSMLSMLVTCYYYYKLLFVPNQTGYIRIAHNKILKYK